jgi:hypothetical protein
MDNKTQNAQHPETQKGMEGEGDKASDKRYREEASRFARDGGKVSAGAKEAARAVDEDDEDLKKADQASRKPSAGDLKKDLQPQKPKP